MYPILTLESFLPLIEIELSRMEVSALKILGRPMSFSNSFAKVLGRKPAD